MIVENEVEIAKITKKLNTFFDVDKYTDFLFLTTEEFISKYGCYGFSFSNFRSVRFDKDPNLLTEIGNFLPEDEYYLISLFKDAKNIYKIEKGQMSKFLTQNKIVDFVVFEIKMTWLLIYDQNRNLTGLGSHIKKKIKRNVSLCFGESKIMFMNSDEIQ